MRKLSESFWNSVNPKYACINELVALPECGDCGFIEYFEHKAESVICEKKIFSSFASQNKLMLEYPEPNCSEYMVFERFFESPCVVAQNHDFEGVFAIDISNYINKLDDDRFLTLISYIKTNTRAVYILFFYSDDDAKIQDVFRSILQHIDIVKTVLPEPTDEQLLDYTLEGLSTLCHSLEEGIRGFFADFYSKNKVGYDAAEYLIRHLRLSGFKGSLDEVETHIKNLNIQSVTSGNYTGLGY